MRGTVRVYYMVPTVYWMFPLILGSWEELWESTTWYLVYTVCSHWYMVHERDCESILHGTYCILNVPIDTWFMRGTVRVYYMIVTVYCMFLLIHGSWEGLWESTTWYLVYTVCSHWYMDHERDCESLLHYPYCILYVPIDTWIMRGTVRVYYIIPIVYCMFPLILGSWEELWEYTTLSLLYTVCSHWYMDHERDCESLLHYPYCILYVPIDTWIMRGTVRVYYMIPSVCCMFPLIHESWEEL